MLNKYKKLLPGGEVLMVNTRDLHNVMGVTQQYSVWVKTRMNSFKFIENTDYLIEYLMVPSSTARMYCMTDYYVTREAAKQIALCEPEGKGFRVYNYFMACDKKQGEPRSYAECLRILADAEEEQLF